MDDFASYSEVLLERRRLVAMQQLPRYVYEQLRADPVQLDWTMDALIHSLRSEVLVKSRQRKEREIVEPWQYETWRDQLIDSLPVGSFRRRFLVYFWGHEARMRRAIHTISTEYLESWPDSPISMPDTWGAMVPIYQLDAFRRYEVPPTSPPWGDSA